jgi:hypothetical protein
MAFLAWKLTPVVSRATQEEKARLIADLQEIEGRPAWKVLRGIMEQAQTQNLRFLRSLQTEQGRDGVLEGVTQGELNIIELLLEPSMGVAQALKMETVPDGEIPNQSLAG